MNQPAAPALSPLTSDASVAGHIYKRIFWRFVPLLVICFVCAYLDRVNISFAKLQMQSQLGLSDAVYGLGASVFFVGYLIFEVPSNLILHRVGARLWIARIMITWGIASACTMFVRDEVSFYVIRFIIGALEAGFVPGALYFFTKWFPREVRGRTNTLFMASIALCGIIGGPISGGIMKYVHGLHGLAGWQWLFLLEGIPSILLGLVVIFMLDDSIQSAKWLSPEEKTVWSRIVEGEKDSQAVHRFGPALREPATYTLSLIYFCLASGIYGLVFWMPQLIRTAGTQDTFVIGLISSLPYIVAAITMVWLGRHSDRTGERRWHLALCALAGGVGYFVCGFFSQNTLVLVIGLTAAATGIISAIGLFWVLPQRFLSGVAAAAGIALINSLGQIGGIVTPYMVGKVKDTTGSATLGLYVVAAVCVLAFVLIAWGLPKRLYERA
ncbi:MFS transporter [Paraburkholderia sp. BCC1886]|uniref:MFS transporter n=1 Tax=Paraburkholderia sp. BCC1886 TaxID=2562670 RepID=UPI0011822CD2|nr:MFS transporter [Paraburkholderia sp. BCC1886]